MTNEQMRKLKAIGTAWGEQEVEAWHDQHDEAATMPAWTMGTYAGDVPAYGDDAELIIDHAAREVWEAAR